MRYIEFSFEKTLEGREWRVQEFFETHHWLTIFLLLLIFSQMNPNVVTELLQTTEEPAVEVFWLSEAPLSPTAGRIFGQKHFCHSGMPMEREQRDICVNRLLFFFTVTRIHDIYSKYSCYTVSAIEEKNTEKKIPLGVFSSCICVL